MSMPENHARQPHGNDRNWHAKLKMKAMGKHMTTPEKERSAGQKAPTQRYHLARHP